MLTPEERLAQNLRDLAATGQTKYASKVVEEETHVEEDQAEEIEDAVYEDEFTVDQIPFDELLKSAEYSDGFQEVWDRRQNEILDALFG